MKMSLVAVVVLVLSWGFALGYWAATAARPDPVVVEVAPTQSQQIDFSYRPCGDDLLEGYKCVTIDGDVYDPTDYITARGLLQWMAQCAAGDTTSVVVYEDASWKCGEQR